MPRPRRSAVAEQAVLAAVRLGGYTYTAVSVIPQDSLIQLLDLLAR